MLLAGLRRFAVLVAIAVPVTAVVSGCPATARRRRAGAPLGHRGPLLVGSVFVMLGLLRRKPAARCAADGEQPGLFGGLVHARLGAVDDAVGARDQISASALLRLAGAPCSRSDRRRPAHRVA